MKKNAMPAGRQGFTLIELLVVISVIGILSGLVLTSYSGAQKQARDSQRRSDLNQYRLALESYAASNNSKYPSYAAETEKSASDLYSDYLSAFMSSAISDPKDTGDYVYGYFEDGSTANPSASAENYVLFGGLETGDYWVLCSNGKTGKNVLAPSSATCPLP